MSTLFDLMDAPAPPPIAAPIETFAWDPAEVVVLPWGAAVLRRDLGPCRQCGRGRFRVWRSLSDGKVEHRLSCPDCAPGKGPKIDRETGRTVRSAETAWGWFDARTGAVEVDRG